MAGGIRSYSTTAANNNAATPYGWPEGQPPSSVNNVARQNMADLRAWYENPTWIDFGDTPTRVSNTVFTVATDLTTRYAAGRRIQLIGATTGYATISSATYSAPDTTITVVMDSGNMPTSLTNVSVSALSLAPEGSDGTRRTAAEIAAGVTPTNYAIPSHLTGYVMPERYGAVGNGTASDTVNGALDTTAIGNAILIASATKVPLLLSRQYIAVPATVSTDENGANTVAWLMRSDLHVVGEVGASITLANGQSTDGTPKDLELFHTNSVLSNISFRGITFDMNGANNKISPSRPASYQNGFNMAMISVSGTPAGVAAKIDDVLIENCTFQNTPGVNCIVMGQTNTVGLLLGKRWTVKNCLFLNNGNDSNDHSSVYGWAEDVLIEGNTFWEDSPTGTTGKTGGYAGWEIHGANTRTVNNLVYNYFRGCYLGTNTTNVIENVVIANNTFITMVTGVEIFRSAANQPTIRGAVIANNTIKFDDSTFAGIQNYKSAIAIDGQFAVSDIQITGNIAYKSGTTITAMLVRLLVNSTAGNSYSDIRILNNTALGFSVGAYITTNATNGMGYIEFSNNECTAFTPGTFGTAFGVIVDATGTIKTLVLEGNRFIDETGASAFGAGISISNGTITDLWAGANTYKNLTVVNYQETGGIAITNRIGPYGRVAITYSASMTPDIGRGPVQVITATNNTAFTINAPINPIPGVLLTVTIRNTSGGALGVATWNAVFKMIAWVQPANTFSASVQFIYDGTNWVELNRGGVTVPN